MTRAADPLHLLIVDDDDVDRMAIRRALAKGGVDGDVSEAVDFDSARKALLTQKLDCVLLDFNLPGGDGLELLRAVREAAVDTPIIALTGQGDEAVAVDFMRNGASDYLQKSHLGPEPLAQSIRRVLRVRDAERRERDAKETLARHAVQLRTLAEVSSKIHAAFSTDETIDLVAQNAQTVFDARIALVIVRGVSLSPVVRLSIADFGVRSGSNAVAAAASETLLFDWGRSLRLTEAELDDNAQWSGIRNLSVHPQFKFRGLLAARLTNREGRTIGCILLSDRKDGDFAPNDEMVLWDFAQTVSIAFENARLYHAEQQATRARDDVLAIVSHDLRNPLYAVSMSASLLRANLAENKPDTARDLSLIDRIDRNATRMNRLIEDLLDATRIDAGKLAVVPIKHYGASLIKEAVESMRFLAEAKKVVLRASQVDDHLSVMADGERILQLFSNLIGNSIKWTESGAGITLTLTREKNEACFAVADEGSGVDPAHIERLFERYWKESKTSRDGAGLGLFIARGIVEAHGGRIAVESERGRGTTVRFWLPLAS